MIYYLITVVFILSVAIASGSIVISSQLRITYKSDFFSTLLFFLAFYFTFGFYVIWGQVIVNSFLIHFVSQELLLKITDILVLLGSPFLVFASLMFVKFTRELSGRTTRNSFVFWFLLINVLLIVGLGFSVFKYHYMKVPAIVRYYVILLSFFYTMLGTYYLLSSRKKPVKFRYNDLRNLSTWLIILMVIQNILLLFYDNSILLALSFIFFYFLYGGFLPVYIKYKANLSELFYKNSTSFSFEKFCGRFEISRRETEIITEICKGLSNQQIADKLFISLQTVKDHTHRIYSKIGCSSRALLIRLVNDSI